ncbi:MAG TPA: selenide, water dikinase SelD, partial [Casimicrobiaceae bacterium]
ILGKPLGVGIYSAAIKKQQLQDDDYAALLACTTRLNTPGMALGRMDAVHALTDVTGFGLLGHLLEICRGSSVGAQIGFDRLPLLPAALSLATASLVTGASARNWASYGAEVTLAPGIDPARRALLSDPQTSGGLLVACAPEASAAVLAVFRAEGFGDACVIGTICAGPSRVEVV